MTRVTVQRTRATLYTLIPVVTGQYANWYTGVDYWFEYTRRGTTVRALIGKQELRKQLIAAMPPRIGRNTEITGSFTRLWRK